MIVTCADEGSVARATRVDRAVDTVLDDKSVARVTTRVAATG